MRYKFFTMSKSAEIMIALVTGRKPKYISQIRKDVKITQAHLRSCISDLEEHGLIKKLLKGRNKYLTLTDSGSIIANKLYEMREYFKDIKLDGVQRNKQ